MADQIWLAGSVTVTNGSATVTGTGTGWVTAGVEGGLFMQDGLVGAIASVESETSLTLAQAWAGPTATGTYSIMRGSSSAASVVDLYDRLAKALITLSMAGIHPNAAGTLTKRDALSLGVDDDEFIFLHAEIGVAFNYYLWNGTSWVGPFPVATPGEPGVTGVLHWITDGWETDDTFAVDDGLAHLGTSYRCHTAHTATSLTEPGVGANWTTVWQVTAARGDTGPGVGVSLIYSTTTADADPGAGKIRFNNATIASATAAYIDNSESGGASITGWLDTFDDSTNTAKGDLVLRGITNPAAWAVMSVTGSVVDGTGYRRLTLTHRASGGTWTNNDVFAVNFIATGNKGADGLGTGDVVGPSSSTDNHVVLFSGTTGKLIKSAGALFSSLASTTYVDGLFTALKNGVSASFDTLSEIATELGLKAPAANPTFTGTITVPDGSFSFAKLASAAIATLAEWRTGTATSKLLTIDQVNGAMAEVSLSIVSGNIAWAMSAGIDLTVTLTANAVLSNPSATIVGRRGRIRVVQDATGGRTLTKSSNMKTPGGAALSIATAANAESFVYYDCVSSTKILLSNTPLAWS